MNQFTIGCVVEVLNEINKEASECREAINKLRGCHKYYSEAEWRGAVEKDNRVVVKTVYALYTRLAVLKERLLSAEKASVLGSGEYTEYLPVEVMEPPYEDWQ